MGKTWSRKMLLMFGLTALKIYCLQDLQKELKCHEASLDKLCNVWHCRLFDLFASNVAIFRQAQHRVSDNHCFLTCPSIRVVNQAMVIYFYQVEGVMEKQ